MTLFTLVHDGRISTKQALKREFRLRALLYHPDRNLENPDEGAFVALQSDFKQAWDFLEARLGGAAGSATPRDHRPLSFMDTFFDLVSLGMFDGRQRARTNKSFTKRFAMAAQIFSRRCSVPGGDFGQAIAQITESDGVKLKPGLDQLFYDMISYRHNPFKHTKSRLLIEIGLARTELSGANMKWGVGLIDCLAQDLLGSEDSDHGPNPGIDSSSVW